MVLNIREIALENSDYRKVIMTGIDSQLVVMSIPPGEDVGDEVYADVDQITVIVDGRGQVSMSGQEDEEVGEDDLIFVKASTRHNLVNIGDTDLKIYTIYAPPEHQPDAVQETKEEAYEDIDSLAMESPLDSSDLDEDISNTNW